MFEFSVFDAYCDGESLWFAAVEYNALYRKSLRDNTFEYLGSFPGEDFLQWRLYTSVHEYGNKLYFTPGSAHEIGVYDMKKHMFSKLPIGISKEENDLSKVKYLKKFASAVIFDGKLFLLPCCYDRLLIVDLSTGVTESDTAMVAAVSEKYDHEANLSDGVFYFCWMARMVDSHTVMFDLHANKNIFITYDLSRRTWEEHSTGNPGSSYAYCEYVDRKVWLYDDKRMELDSRSLDEKSSATYKLPGNNAPRLFSAMFEHEGALYFLPADGKNVIRFSIASRAFEKVEIWDGSNFYSSVVVKHNDTLYLFDVKRKGFFTCCRETRDFLPCIIDAISMKTLNYKLYEKLAQDGKGIVFENDFFTLKDFLHSIQSAEAGNGRIICSYEKREICGQKIWETIQRTF